MTDRDAKWIRYLAETELAREQFNQDVEAEKARLRRRARWARFLKRLAFWRFL